LRLGVEAAEVAPGVRSYPVVPPFGQGLVIAVLSPTLLPALVAVEVQALERYVATAARVLGYARTLGPLHVSSRPLQTRAR
jgi:hypothetical protein